MTIPAAYTSGSSLFARFRLFDPSNLPGGSLDANDYLGFATGGEVEDYLFSLRQPDYTILKTVTDVGGEGASASVDEAGDIITYQVVWG